VDAPWSSTRSSRSRSRRPPERGPREPVSADAGAGAAAASAGASAAAASVGASSTAGTSGVGLVSSPRSERDFLSAILCAHLVLAVHRRDVEDLRILAAVRVLGAVVEVQRTHLIAAQRTARDHALDSLLKHA